jgi:hypothetical protein
VPDWSEITCRFPPKSPAAFDRNQVPVCSDFCKLIGAGRYCLPSTPLRAARSPVGDHLTPKRCAGSCRAGRKQAVAHRLGHVSQLLNSIARPEFHIERGLASRPALPAAQLPLKRHEARVTGPPLQQRRVRNEGLVPAGMAARAHQVEDAQVLEAEGVARRHGRACSFLPVIV